MLSKMVSKVNNILKVLMYNRTEKALLMLVFLFSTVLFVTQVGLVSDKFRPYLTDVEVFEGKYINQVDNLIQEGTITLELIDMSKEKDIKVLVNGKETAQFDKRFVTINVRNNSIVEIDGSRLKSPARVRITDKSDNIISDEINKEVKVESNIGVLTRIRIK